MEENNSHLSSDFLENETLDFDLAPSPNINQNDTFQKNKAAVVVDDDEDVFVVTEQCLTTQAKTLPQENKIKPLSPLTGEQFAEVFKEANKVTLRLGKLSTTLKSPLSNSDSSVGSLSSSSSILKLSSTASESPNWLTGKLSNSSSEGINFSGYDFDIDKENINPLLANVENIVSDRNKSGQTASSYLEKYKITHFADEKNYDFEKGDLNSYLNKNEKHSSSDTLPEEQLVIWESEKLPRSDMEQSNDTCKENIKSLSAVKDDVDALKIAKQASELDNVNALNIGKQAKELPMFENITFSSKESGPLDSNEMQQNQGTDHKTHGLINQVKSKRIPVVKSKRSNLPRPGMRNSRLPKLRNAEKLNNTFSSPSRSNCMNKSMNKKKEAEVQKAEYTVQDQLSSKNSEAGNSSNKKLQTGSSSKLSKDPSKANSRTNKTLAKRKIFNSNESLDKFGTKDHKPTVKVPVSGRQVMARRGRRRRSISLSSLESVQSTTPPNASQDENTNKLTRPSTKIPKTKVNLGCTVGVTRRSKLQDSTPADKKPQPLKALQRPGLAASAQKNKSDASQAMPPPSTAQEVKDEKIPMPATPRSSSSLPVAKKRSSFKSSLSSTSSREGSPPKYITPRKPGKKIPEPRSTSSACKRRSLNPTPSRNAPSSVSRRALRSSGDDSRIMTLSPERKPKSTRKTNRKLIPDNGNTSLTSQTVDDLLEFSVLEDVLPIEPQPVPQANTAISLVQRTTINH